MSHFPLGQGQRPTGTGDLRETYGCSAVAARVVGVGRGPPPTPHACRDVTDAAETIWARAKDATKLFEAIKAKLQNQAAYAVWRQGVAAHGGDRKSRSRNSDLDLPASDPGKDVIARWRERLCVKLAASSWRTAPATTRQVGRAAQRWSDGRSPSGHCPTGWVWGLNRFEVRLWTMHQACVRAREIGGAPFPAVAAMDLGGENEVC
jgi:hypothetical protein